MIPLGYYLLLQNNFLFPDILYSDYSYYEVSNFSGLVSVLPTLVLVLKGPVLVLPTLVLVSQGPVLSCHCWSWLQDWNFQFRTTVVNVGFSLISEQVDRMQQCLATPRWDVALDSIYITITVSCLRLAMTIHSVDSDIFCLCDNLMSKTVVWGKSFTPLSTRS